MDSKSLPVIKRVQILVEKLDGEQKINKALSNCKNSEAMISILLEASASFGLDLTKEDLIKTPPIRDWIWWKNKQALVTIGTGTLRHQQDSSGKTRWDSWTLALFDLFQKGR